MQRALQQFSAKWLFRSCYGLLIVHAAAAGPQPGSPATIPVQQGISRGQTNSKTQLSGKQAPSQVDRDQSVNTTPAGVGASKSLIGSASDPAKPVDAGAEMQIGSIYEKQDRLDDAEKAYVKAFETGSATQRQEARQALERVLAQKESFVTKHLLPAVSTIFQGLMAALAILALVVLLWWPAKKYGEHWGRTRLQIGAFIDATNGGSGTGLGGLIKHVVETVQEYYKPRDRFRFKAFNSLTIVDSPGAPELAKLAADVVSSRAGEIFGFVGRTFLKPHYRITGMVQRVDSTWSVLLQLDAGGTTIGRWDGTYDGPNPVYYQKSIAFQVAMRLKDYAGISRD